MTNTLTVGACLGPEHATALATGGEIDFLEVNVQGFLVPLAGDEAFAPNLEKARQSALPLLAANCFLPGQIKSVGPEANQGEVLTYGATAFARARACGIRTIVFGSGGSRQLPDGISSEAALPGFINLLRSLGPLAEAEGVILVLEPLNRSECNFIHTVKEGAEIVRKVGHSSVRLLADLYHMARNGESFGDLVEVTDLLAHVHVAECARRTPPGVEGDNFEEAFRVLKAGGYTGALSVEANWSDPVAEAPVAAATLREQWGRV